MSGRAASPSAIGDPAVAAAVVSVFDLDWIAPDPTDDEVEALADFLATSCERVVDEAGVPRWRLRDDERARVLRDVPRERLRDVLHALPERPDDAVQRLLERYLDGTMPALGEMDADALAGVRQLARWVGPEGGLPAAADVRARLDRVALTAPLERLLARGFVGREDVLAELAAFVAGPAAARAFVLEGVGGAGKSTVLARFLLDVMARGDLAVYLNCDRGWLIDGGPWAMYDEIVRQLGAQDVALAGWATKTRLQAQSGGRGKGGYREIASRGSQSFVELPDSLLRAVAGAVPPGRVLVLVVDTYEELARRDWHHLAEVDLLLDALRRVAPGVRAVLAGRTVVDQAKHGARVWPLRGLGEADAVDLLRHLAPGEDDGVLTEIARRVEGNPLSLHLAADVLRRTGTNPVRLLAVAEGDVQGQLYARLLEHIRDPRVRAIAHPGLVVRRITPEVIQEVLAEPCGIAPLGDAEARDLFESLRREATLCEPSPDGDGSLVHRQDVRAIMLPAIQREMPGTTQAIHAAAAGYYARSIPRVEAARQRVLRREVLYHLLMLKVEPAELDVWWTAEAGQDLAAAVDELPTRSQAFLVSRVPGLRLDADVRAAADDDEWCHAVRPAAEARLQRRMVEAALELVRERRGADGRALLPDLEIEALERLDRVAEALALAAAEYDRAVRRGSHRAMREMLTHRARILERLRRWDEAATILTELAALDRERRARTDRLDEEVRTRELVVLTSLLRIARHQRRDVAALVDETVTLAEATPPRLLVRSPSLLRDLGAEIGKRSPKILALATSTLADTARVAEERPIPPPPPPPPPPAQGSSGPEPEDADWSDRFAADADESQDYL